MFLALTLPWIWARGLQNPDELRYATIVVEMIARDDYVTPYLNGAPYLEKPPLIYWLGIVAVKLLGNNFGAFRLCSILAGLSIIVLSCKLGRAYGGEKAGLYAGLITSTTVFPFAFSQAFTPDILVAAWISLSIWLIYKIAASDASGSAPRTYVLCFYTATGLGVLSKGLIGIVLPALILILYTSRIHSWRFLLHFFRAEGLALFLIITVPWHLWVEHRNNGFLHYYFINQHILRYTTALHGREKPLWYLPLVSFIGTIPWSFFAIAAICLPDKSLALPDKDRSISKLLTVWLAVTILFFWVSRSLLPGYLLPIVPAISAMIGTKLQSRGNPMIIRSCAAASAIFMFAAIVFFESQNLLSELPIAITEVEVYWLFISVCLLFTAYIYIAFTAKHAVSLIVLFTIPLLLLTGYLATKNEPRSLRSIFIEHPDKFIGREIAVYKTYLVDPIYYQQTTVYYVDRITELGSDIPTVDFHWDSEKFNAEIHNGRRFVLISRENDLIPNQDLDCFAKKNGYIACTIN